MDIKERIRKIADLAVAPLSQKREDRRVEIIMLKFKESPEIIDKAISRIIHNTDWPFKLNVFDNRPLVGEENNRNTAKIWNYLVNQATCNYICIIDSDAYVPVRNADEKCWLTRMMESIGEVGLVIPVSNAPGGAHQHVSHAEAYPAMRRNRDAWSGYCFLFSKEAYNRIGSFDERFYIYGQDSEWAIRAGRVNYGATMRLDVLVEHIGGASFKSDPIREDDKFYARELFLRLTK